MTFAITEAKTKTATDQTAHTVSVPAHAAGDRLIFLGVLDGGSRTFTAGLEAWTQIGAGGAYLQAYEVIDTDNSISSLSLTSSAAEQMIAIVYAISGAHDTTASEIATLDRTAVGTTVAFTALGSYSWNGEESLFISGLGWDRSGTATIPSAGYSTDYAVLTANDTSAAMSTSVGIATQSRVGTQALEDPTDWTISNPRAGTAFVIAIRAAAVAGTVTVTDAGDEAYFDGETGITVTGTGFGASQGAGSVVISPTDDIADGGAVTQTVTSWADTSIVITAVRGSITFGATAYLFVEEDGAASNASGFPVTFITRGPQRRMMLGMG